MSTKKEKIAVMARSYPRFIEWSKEDKCFVGSAPPLIGHCCHADTEAEVATLLHDIVLDLVEDVIDGKMPVPKELSEKTYSGRFLTRIDPALHKKLVLQAAARDVSFNKFVEGVLQDA